MCRTILAIALAACTGTSVKGDESPPPDDGKDDSFQHPTDHGGLSFGVPATAELGAVEQFHAWTFALSDTATVRVATGPAEIDGDELDTVLYLYRRKDTGWGRYIGRNDDFGGTFWSAIRRSLGPGTYRVLVKGYFATDIGPFALTADCSGAGCPPPPCLFGASLADLSDDSHVRQTGATTLTAASAIDPILAEQIVAALHVSAHTDVQTVEDAFGRVGRGEINRLELWDGLGNRSFTALQYTAGDNPYGAIFRQGTVELVTEIRDGDFYSCTVQPEVCALGHTYGEFRDGEALQTTQPLVVLTRQSALSELRGRQVIAAVRESAADDVTTLDEAFASVDGGEVNMVTRRLVASGEAFTAFEYGAGDNSYGAIFAAGTTTRAAAIHDGDFYECAVFAAP